jgi:hypothetical protein
MLLNRFIFISKRKFLNLIFSFFTVFFQSQFLNKKHVIFPNIQRPQVKKNKAKIFDKIFELNDLFINSNIKKLYLYKFFYYEFLQDNKKKNLKNHYSLITKLAKKNKFNSIAWDPYPSSLRLVNITKWLLHHKYHNKHLEKIVFTHMIWIFLNQEKHLMGNHYLENLKAMIFGSILFENFISKFIFEYSTKRYLLELNKQVTKDGIYIERSPMYHLIILLGVIETFCLIKKLKNNAKISNGLKRILLKLYDGHSFLKHPDHKISYFNDSVFSDLPDNKYISSLLKSQKINTPQVKTLTTVSNENRFHFHKFSNKRFFLIIDSGKISPTQNPGHCHDEFFSFELSLKKLRFFTINGISNYENSKKRHIERSAISHNTIYSKTTDNNKIWHRFRIGRRASVIEKKINKKNKTYVFDLFGKGFMNEVGEHKFRRKFIIDNKKITIEDNLELNDGNSIFHLHPNVIIKRINSCKYTLTRNEINLTFNIIIGRANIKKSIYSYDFYDSKISKAINVRHKNFHSKIEIIINE